MKTPHLKPPRRRSAVLAALVCAALAALCALPRPAEAATTISLYKSFAGNINFVTTGNTLRAGSNTTYGGNPCTLVSGNTGTTAGTGTSASPLSNIPAGSTIVAAYMYIAGSGATVPTSVSFNGNTLAFGRTFTDSTNDTGNPFFAGFVDVTSLVTGNATITAGNFTVDTTNTYCGNSTVLAGWTLVVIYSNASEAYRVINVFDGFQPFHGSSITLTPNNFKVPASPINGKFAVITWEGDPDINGTNGVTTNTETLEFNGNVLSDACNPTADTSLPNGSNGGAFVSGNPNQYNSTINTLSCTGNLTPTGDEKYFGVDLDTFDISSTLTAGETSATTFYSTGQDLVFLTTQVVSVTDVPVADLAITKVHNGTFGYSDNGTYTITVTNNGPSTSTGTATVTDTLPAGETYVSATGTGWTCANASGTVTCTNPETGGLNSGSNLPAITLTVTVSPTAGATLSNTATVAGSGNQFDNNSANNSSTDTVSPVHPDLHTSTKSVFNTGGGDALVGSTLQYTITFTETGGVAASGVSVTDNIPANLSNFTVTSIPAGATDSSTGSGTGTNNDGLLNVTGITVPANGSVTVVFTAQVAAGTANCTAITNNATITNPGGSTTSIPVGSPSTVVAQSSCTSSGNKYLYLYDTIVTGTTREMSREPETTSASVAITSGTTITWEQQPTAAKTITLPVQSLSANLYFTRSGTNSNRSVKVNLVLASAPATVLATQTLTFNPGTTASLHTFTLTTTAVITVNAGDALEIQVDNTSGAGLTVNLFPTGGATDSYLQLATSTVINVDSVTAYSTAYSATSTQATYLGGNSVYICAVVSDPFGSADIDPATGGTAPTLTLTDPTGTVQLNAVAMTKEGATDCGGNTNAADEAFEYVPALPPYTLPANAAMGIWTATVTAYEGAEPVTGIGTKVTDTANGTFAVSSLVVTKTVQVLSDPVEGTTRPKSIPGATMQYTVTVQNNGIGPADSGSLTITDPVPTDTVFDLTGATPFTFTNGSTASGLSAPVMTFSNNHGSTYVYSPSCTRPCTDAAITNFKLTFTGSMNGKTGATAPSFTITYQVVIQ